MIVCEADTQNNFGQKGYLKVENVTMVRPGLFFSYDIGADAKQVPDTQDPDRC